MIRNFLVSLALAGFALSGCEEHVLTADLPGEVQVVYLNGEPDHCIVVLPGQKAAPATDSAPQDKTRTPLESLSAVGVVGSRRPLVP